jgi:predicted dehydrogenase
VKQRLKILMVGLGAAGQRHARNLRAILGDELELLAFRSGRGNVALNERFETLPGVDPAVNLGARVFSKLDDALSEHPRAVFIANPSSLHLPVARAAAEAGCGVFLEKPLSHSWEGVPEFLALVEQKGLPTFVGYQWRFHPLLLAIRSWLETRPFGRIVAARAAFGEYLPGWHPYEDYRQSYAARKELGGGVLLTQIHDFDYLGWLLGWPDQVFSVGGHVSNLEINVEDVASTLLRCMVDGRSIPVHVHQDYLQRPPVRGCQLIAEGGRVEIDLAKSTLRALDASGKCVQEEDFSRFPRNDLFLAETRHFLNCLSGCESSLIPAQEGARSLAVALAAQRSLGSGVPETVVYP